MFEYRFLVMIKLYEQAGVHKQLLELGKLFLETKQSV